MNQKSKPMDVLCEIRCENIPARFVDFAEFMTKDLWEKGLAKNKFFYNGIQVWITPKRIAIYVSDVQESEASKKTFTLIKGPKTGSDTKIVEAFYRSHNLTLQDATKEMDSKKGSIYVVKKEIDVPPVSVRLRNILLHAISNYQWPSSMQWGTGTLSFIRPITSICFLCDNLVVNGQLDVSADICIPFGRTTTIHESTISISSAQDYTKIMDDHHILYDIEKRYQRVKEGLNTTASLHKIQWTHDDNLIRTNANLTENPKVMLGTFDQRFLELPSVIIQTVLAHHQKCFVPKHSQSLPLPYYAFVMDDHPNVNSAQVTHGFNKVIDARLHDADYFYKSDLKHSLSHRVKDLSSVQWHEGMGTLLDKVHRMQKLTDILLPIFNNKTDDPLSSDHIHRSINLCKADLTTQLVQEMPELQGIAGGLYAQAKGEPQDVVNAITEHYKPMGNNNKLPQSLLAQFISLIDKLDTLMAFGALGQLPTGSKDPYGIRRATLGIIRLFMYNKPVDLCHHINISPLYLIQKSHALYEHFNPQKEWIRPLENFFLERLFFYFKIKYADHIETGWVGSDDVTSTKEYTFPPLILQCFMPKLKNEWNFGLHQLITGTSQITHWFEYNHPDTESYDKQQQSTAPMLLLEGFRRLYPFKKHMDADNIFPLESLNMYATVEEKALLQLASQKNMHKNIYQDTKYLEFLASLRDPIYTFCEQTMILDKYPTIRKRRLSLIWHVLNLYEQYGHFEAFGGEDIEHILKSG